MFRMNVFVAGALVSLSAMPPVTATEIAVPKVLPFSSGIMSGPDATGGIWTRNTGTVTPTVGEDVSKNFTKAAVELVLKPSIPKIMPGPLLTTTDAVLATI